MPDIAQISNLTSFGRAVHRAALQYLSVFKTPLLASLLVALVVLSNMLQRSTAESSLHLILEESGPAAGQAVALDSALSSKGPFPLVNANNVLNRGVDRNTRVTIFVNNLQLAAGEVPSSVVVSLIDSSNQDFDVAAEDVRPVPGFSFSQVVFRLPNDLSAGICTLRVKAKGQTSNIGTIAVALAGSMLDGALQFTGPIPSLTDITYTTKAGDQLTVQFAYSGLVELLVNPATPESTILAAIQAGGGTVIEKIPLAGIFLVQVVPGSEASFLSTIYAQSWLLDGAPASSLDVACGIVVVDSFRENGNFPPTDSCNRRHGDHVLSILQRNNSCVTTIDNFWDAVKSIPKPNWYPTVTAHVLREMELAAHRGERTVFNLSLQPKISGAVGSIDRSNCSDGLCREIRREQLLFFMTLLQGLEKTIEKRPHVTDNSVIVVAAGNAGVDLSIQLQTLKQQFPKAFSRLLIVGSSNSSGDVVRIHNHATANMVFARGISVQAGADVCSGTSFAAPEVSRVLEHVWSRNPTLTSDALINTFQQALSELGTNNVTPQDANGLTTQTFLNRAVTVSQQTLTWQVSGQVLISGVSTALNGSVVLPRSGGSGSFQAGPATIRISVSGSTLTIGGNGFGSDTCFCDDDVSGTYNCRGGGAGQGAISESQTAFTAAGPVGGTLNCTCSCDGSLDTFPISGSFSATAAK